MFILKRQDVEISSVQHPKKDQQIPILSYQGQTFRLISVFDAQKAEEARAFWRDLTDNRGKACVLLEEPDRYSVWGKVRLEQLGHDDHSTDGASPLFIQGCLLLLQAVYFDVEDLLGAKQAKSFQQDIGKMFQKWKFPQTETPEMLQSLLKDDLLNSLQLPNWQEHHLYTLLEELHRLGKSYFGNDSFAEGVEEILQDMSSGDRTQFISWLGQSPFGKLWT